MQHFVPHRSRTLARYSLPSGGGGRVIKHRVYRNPSGGLLDQPIVARAGRAVVVKQLPASTGGRPPGTSGAWVQLSTSDPTAAILHAPGRPPESVRVQQVVKVGGKTEAIIRQRIAVAVNPAPQAAAAQRRVVSSRLNRTLAGPRAVARAGDRLTRDAVARGVSVARDLMGMWSLDVATRRAAIQRLVS